MNWTADCGYAPDVKRRFHSAARARLRQLAQELRLPAGSYDLRSNQGGVAVSGEITLHHETVYVQASQSALGGGMSVLIRTCRGRRDYSGGPNNFVPLAILDDISALAERVRAVAGRQPGFATAA